MLEFKIKEWSLEILLNNEIQTFFYSNEVTFSKGEKYKCIHH
jgi:hypothetical protein